MKYGFIGFGNLAKAIYKGLKEEKELSFAYFDKLGLAESGPEKLDSIEGLVKFSDVVFICVKPQNLDEALVEMGKINLEGKVVVSPVAGKDIAYFEKSLKDVPIVRIMPNLAMAYQKSVTAFCANKENDLVKNVEESLNKLGKVVRIPEEKFHIFTALFGSSPAFILEILKVFKNKAKELEISELEINSLLSLLLDGTNTYFSKNISEKSVEELVQSIASKGGVTERGLKTFEEKDLGNLFLSVLEDAEKRSEEMGK